MLSVLEGTQRVPPTCMIKTDFTYLHSCGPTPGHTFNPHSSPPYDGTHSHNPVSVLQWPCFDEAWHLPSPGHFWCSHLESGWTLSVNRSINRAKNRKNQKNTKRTKKKQTHASPEYPSAHTHSATTRNCFAPPVSSNNTTGGGWEMVDVGRGAWSPWKTAPVMYLVCGCVALVCPGVNAFENAAFGGVGCVDSATCRKHKPCPLHSSLVVPVESGWTWSVNGSINRAKKKQKNKKTKKRKNSPRKRLNFISQEVYK